MQRILEANWQDHLLSSILRGQFMMSRDLALGTYHRQFSSILNSENLYRDNLQYLESIPVKAYDGDEEYVAENLKEKESQVIVLPVKGAMLKYGTWWSYGMDEIAHYIKHFASKDNVSAIVLDIDSGGGAVNAIPPLLEAISFVKALNKPIVAHCDSACSAAYWTAAACDHIFANNTVSSIFGSIGTMLSYLDIIPYYEKEGAKYHEVYSDHSSDKNSASQKLREGEYDQIKEEMLNPMAIQFQNAVKSARPNLKLDTPGILTGATYPGQKAIDIGLVDKIGTLKDAINYASAQAWARN